MTDLRKASEMALEALESLDVGDTYKTHNAASALRQALAQPDAFIYSQNKAFRINPSTGDFGIGSAPAKTLEHKDWCASLTQVLACHPPRPAPCNCKPEYVDAVNISQERVDETTKREHEPMNDRERLETIVNVICRYLPPSGIDIKTAMSEIIELVDPLPPKRKWVGLTDEDFNVKKVGEFDVVKFAKYIETLLKERNFGSAD